MLTWDPTKVVEIVRPENVFNESIETDVKGINSDGVYKKGFDNFALFDVDESDFLNNMEAQRQRCRFKNKKVTEYMQQTRYKKPFYIRYKNESGKEYIRKIK